MKNAQSTHAVHISLLAANNVDEPVPQDDLAHLGDVRAVRRVNVASPVVSTPALTNEDSSQISSSGSGPTSIGETPLAGHQTGYYPRTYLNGASHDLMFSAGLPGPNYSDTRRQGEDTDSEAFGNTSRTSESLIDRRAYDHVTERQQTEWHPGFMPDIPLRDQIRSPDVDRIIPSWFQQTSTDASFIPSEYEDATNDFRHERGETHYGQVFASHVSPDTRAGLILPFDQLDAYGIFMGRHDLMTESGFEEQMPLLPGTNIEQFLASLDRNMS